MMKQIFKSFPDNKPISGLCIVEDIAKCPSGYSPVSNMLVPNFMCTLSITIHHRYFQ